MCLVLDYDDIALRNVLGTFELFLLLASMVSFMAMSLPIDAVGVLSLARWPIPAFEAQDSLLQVVNDAARSVLSLFEALGWVEAERCAPPPMAIMTPTDTREGVNVAAVKALFAQPGLGMDGFDQDGVQPFWMSVPIMSTKSLQSLSSERMRSSMETDPRALLIKGDPGSTSFMSRVKKYFVGAVDTWVPEEPG